MRSLHCTLFKTGNIYRLCLRGKKASVRYFVDLHTLLTDDVRPYQHMVSGATWEHHPQSKQRKGVAEAMRARDRGDYSYWRRHRPGHRQKGSRCRLLRGGACFSFC